MHILVVEDDDALRESLKIDLMKAGHGVEVARDGEEALFVGMTYTLDGAVVDVGLPGISGLEVIRHWRRNHRHFPIVILSGRTGCRNRMEGIVAGADDYMEKPFSIEEVIVRLQCVARRSLGWKSPEIVCGAIVLDMHHRAVHVNGRPIELTSREYRLLEILMLNARKVLSGSALLEHLYSEATEHESNIVSHFICRLRRKLDPLNQLKPIETVYGGGYRFAIAPRSAPGS